MAAITERKKMKDLLKLLMQEAVLDSLALSCPSQSEEKTRSSNRQDDDVDVDTGKAHILSSYVLRSSRRKEMD